MNRMELNLRSWEEWGCYQSQKYPLSPYACVSILLCQQVCEVKDTAWCGHEDWNPLRLSSMWSAGPAEVAVWCLVLGCGHREQAWIWRNPRVRQSKALFLFNPCHLLTLWWLVSCVQNSEASVYRSSCLGGYRTLKQHTNIGLKSLVKFLTGSDDGGTAGRYSEPSPAKHWFPDLTSIGISRGIFWNQWCPDLCQFI